MAWVREKHPKRKEVDSTENLRGALEFFSCRPHPSKANKIDRSKILKHQPAMHNIIVERPLQGPLHNEEKARRSGRQNPDHPAIEDIVSEEEEYEERMQRRPPTQRIVNQRTQQVSRAQSTPKARPGAKLRPLPTHHHPVAESSSRSTSRWSNATTPLRM